MHEYSQRSSIPQDHPHPQKWQRQIPVRLPLLLQLFTRPHLIHLLSASATDLQMSFPPSTTSGSAAADLAVFMHPSTPWDTEWYSSSSPIPEASGRPVARGECWDIAHEALLHAESLFGPRDAPILSTSRAHGHLLFCGKPGVGRWRGGDDRLRAGDIVEWRSVRIGMGQYGAFALLGEPDHTAALVQDTVPRCAVADGQSVKPADVGILIVVEQTAGRAPKRGSYDLAKLQQGEVWVYRPVGMVMYLGSTLRIDTPPGLETFAV